MKLGCSEIDITPNIPINLGGYGQRQLPSNGISTNLYARGFVFDDDGLRTGLITADLLMLNLEQVQHIKIAASQLTGISPDNIIISCSHTHSGPSPFSFLGNPADSVYIDWLLKALAGTLVLAGNNIEPVQAGFASTSVYGISTNRRDPDQDVDRELTVLGFQGQSGTLKALLFNFPCHPTVLGADNLLVSAEYPGAAAATVKKLFPETVTGFINGACGDISTRFSRRAQSHDEVQRIGTILGARAAALAAELCFEDANLAVALLTIPVELKPTVTEETMEREVAHWQQRLTDLKSKGAKPGELRVAQTGLEGAKLQKLGASVRDQLPEEVELVIWRVGSLGLVTVPGELFSSLGQKIKGESPFSATIIAGYSNGYLGYIPDSEAYQQGGYETLSSPLAQGFGEHLATAAVDKLLQLCKLD